MTTEALNLPTSSHRITNLKSALIVMVAAFAMFATNGLIFVGLTVFDPEMLDRLGVSVAALKAGLALTFITAAILSPLSGYMLDRFGVRPIMAIGMVVLAIGLYMYADAANLIEIYLIHVIFGCCLVMAGLFVCIMLITGVTDRHRGVAVGVVLAGASLGQAVSPKLNLALEGVFGWQNAARAGAILPLLLLPIILILVPVHRSRETLNPETAPRPSGLSYGEALRTRSFWLLSVIAMVTFFAQLGIVSNLVIYIEKQLTLPEASAGQAVFAISVASLLSHLAVGFLIDRVGVKPVHVISVLVSGAGIAALAFSPPSFLLLSVTCIGIGWGGNYTAIQVSTSKLFSGSAIGRILGTINIIEAIGAGFGPPGIGRLYDITHNYAVPFAIVAVFVLLTSVAVAQITAPKAEILY